MENPLKRFNILSVDAKNLPRSRENRNRLNKVALQVHWEMCIKYVIECSEWYDHQPLPVTENGKVRITWDMTIYTDKRLKHNRPDITLVHEDKQE